VHIIKPRSDCAPSGGRGYQCGGQPGIVVDTEAARIVPTDATAAVFYCTNANNRWVGNSASGGFSGFIFPSLPDAVGESRNTGVKPCTKPLLEFDSNTAHSSGRFGARSGCIYVGGRLTEKNGRKHDYTYVSGRTTPEGGRSAGAWIFTNTKTFLCNRGMMWWGRGAAEYVFGLEGFEAHDVERSSQQLGDTYMAGAIVSARTGNTFASSDLPKACVGFEMYGTGLMTLLADVTFRNFNREGDVCVQDLVQSNAHKMTGMFNCRGFAYENVDFSKRFLHTWRFACGSAGGVHRALCGMGAACDARCPGLSGASALGNLQVSDGTPIGWELGATILGSADISTNPIGGRREWWHLDDSCELRSDWGFWACPTYGRREVISLNILKGLYGQAPDQLTSSDRRYDPGLVEGLIYHFGHEDRYIDLGFGGSEMITGACCDIGWYLHLNEGAQKELTVYLHQMVPEGGLVFATSYPKGAMLRVHRCLSRGCQELTQAASFAEMVRASGTRYFFGEDGVLYIKLLDEENSYRSAVGLRQLNHQGTRRNHRYTVTSDKGGSVPFSLPRTLLALPTPQPQPTPQPAPQPTPAMTRAPTSSPTFAPTATPAPTPQPPPAPAMPQSDMEFCKAWCTSDGQEPDCSRYHCTECPQCVASPTPAPKPSPAPAPTSAPTPAATITPSPAPTQAGPQSDMEFCKAWCTSDGQEPDCSRYHCTECPQCVASPTPAPKPSPAPAPTSAPTPAATITPSPAPTQAGPQSDMEFCKAWCTSEGKEPDCSRYHCTECPQCMASPTPAPIQAEPLLDMEFCKAWCTSHGQEPDCNRYHCMGCLACRALPSPLVDISLLPDILPR